MLPKNVWQYVVGVPRMSELGTRYVLQGGTQKNLAAVKAQVDYIRARVPGAEIRVHPHCGEAGAIGAAMETLREVQRKGGTSFIGIDQAIALNYTSRTDDSTICTFCPNRCMRTFIDTETPDGRTSRYISGFSCAKGMVEGRDELKAQVKRKKALRRAYPNLVNKEAALAFRHGHEPRPLPLPGSPVQDIEVRRTLLGKVKRRAVSRGFQRSSKADCDRRKQLRIGIPRAMNIYATAPMWRGYFEAVRIDSHHLIFSDVTGEEMFAEGGKYGSVDPCFPSKVVQAHVHNLLFHKHEGKRTGPLDYIFFPCMTHVPTFVSHVKDTAACPIVAGTPKVTRAAFTKEVDFFARAGVDYVDPAVTITEKELFNQQMWEAWGHRLRITRDEHDYAMSEAWRAEEEFDQAMQVRGREILEQVEREGRLAVLMLSRPYHLDPGLHHGIPDEVQALGYPILSIRSIPKDPEWLAPFFADDLKAGRIADVFDIRDTWPENYSANSVQKVWAARFAARHPNVVVLDLSSFKCGHDAPTHGMIDDIIHAGQTPRLIMHDVDANRPAGSIAIRTKTFAHSLTRHQRELDKQHQAFEELKARITLRLQQIKADPLHAEGTPAPAPRTPPARRRLPVVRI